MSGLAAGTGNLSEPARLPCSRCVLFRTVFYSEMFNHTGALLVGGGRRAYHCTGVGYTAQ